MEFWDAVIASCTTTAIMSLLMHDSWIIRIQWGPWRQLTAVWDLGMVDRSDEVYVVSETNELGTERLEQI